MDPEHIIIAIKLICIHITVCFIAMVAGCSISAWAPPEPPEPRREMPTMTDAVAQRIWAYSFVSGDVPATVDHEFMEYLMSSDTNSVVVGEE
jgi:hypothetical protein